MSRIKINISAVMSYQGNLQENSFRASDVEHQVSLIRNQISHKILSRKSIGQRLNSIALDIHNAERQIKRLKAFMNESTKIYSSAERKVTKMSTQLLSINNANIDQLMMGVSKTRQKHGSKSNKSSWEKWHSAIVEALTNDEGGLVSELLLGGFTASLVSKYYMMPKFLKDGKYLKVINSQFYKGGQGLARWYTIENVMNGKYPHVSKLLKIDNGLKIAGKLGVVGGVITGAAQIYKELVTDDKISTKRKVINASVKGAEVAATVVVGAKIGAAMGTLIAPGVGTAAGAIIGAGFAAGSAYFMDKGFNLQIWGSGKVKKSTLDVIGDGVEKGVDFVGNVAKGNSKWFGNLFKDKPMPVTGAS